MSLPTVLSVYCCRPGQKYIQPVEQARPNDTNEEDLQLKLAIELSKQQAVEEKRIV